MIGLPTAAAKVRQRLGHKRGGHEHHLRLGPLGIHIVRKLLPQVFAYRLLLSQLVAVVQLGDVEHRRVGHKRRPNPHGCAGGKFVEQVDHRLIAGLIRGIAELLRVAVKRRRPAGLGAIESLGEEAEIEPVRRRQEHGSHGGGRSAGDPENRQRDRPHRRADGQQRHDVAHLGHRALAHVRRQQGGRCQQGRKRRGRPASIPAPPAVARGAVPADRRTNVPASAPNPFAAIRARRAVRAHRRGKRRLGRRRLADDRSPAASWASPWTPGKVRRDTRSRTASSLVPSPAKAPAARRKSPRPPRG